MPQSVNVQSNATAFSDLKTMVLEIFKRTDKTTELERAINNTYREMSAAIEPRKLQEQIYQVCTIRQEDYAVPDTILRVNHPLRLIEPGSTNNSSQSGPLIFIPKDEYDVWEPNPNATTINPGRPEVYTFYKNSFLLSPIPDKAYVIEANVGGEPIVLSAATDTTIFSPVWDEVLISGALARLYLGIGLKEETENWMNIYRYGFTGDKDNITGGLGLIKSLNKDNGLPPSIVKYRDF